MIGLFSLFLMGCSWNLGGRRYLDSAPLVTPNFVQGLADAGAATATSVETAIRVAMRVFMIDLFSLLDALSFKTRWKTYLPSAPLVTP